MKDAKCKQFQEINEVIRLDLENYKNKFHNCEKENLKQNEEIDELKNKLLKFKDKYKAQVLKTRENQIKTVDENSNNMSNSLPEIRFHFE